jgi:amidase
MDAFPSALETARLIRTKEVSPVEVMEETLRRLDERNPVLNAVIWRNDDEALAQAKRAADRVATEPTDALPPFLGVPLPIKDLTDAAGQPNTYGSHGASDELVEEDDLVVAAFRRGGFILTGRTNTPEMGPITAAENDRYGITRNPWNTEHTPGGSSGGAAASTAAGTFALAHANDGGGSIRIPASCCGLVGLKVSRGRVPALVESWEGASVEGVVTHTVADTAAVLDLISQPDPLCWYQAPPPQRSFAAEVGADPGKLRIGVVEDAPLGIAMADACRAALDATARLLESLGHTLVPAAFDFDLELLTPMSAMIDGSYTQSIDDWERCEPHNQAGRRRGLATSSIQYVEAVGAMQRFSRDLNAAWGRDFDVLLSPTMAIEPAPAGQILAEAKADPENPSPTVVSSVLFTMVFNISGLPAISLPLHQSATSGLPIGVQLVERPFNEAGLIRLAAQLEAAAPWSGRHPSL